jgi:hypothetical protein
MTFTIFMKVIHKSCELGTRTANFGRKGNQMTIVRQLSRLERGEYKLLFAPKLVPKKLIGSKFTSCCQGKSPQWPSFVL